MDIEPNITKALVSGGLFGSITRLLLKPEKNWQAWLVQLVVGLSAAVFIGGFFGHILNADVFGYGASSYVVGTAAERAIKKLQEKFLS
ncbi:hypothetical protein OAI07_01415 [Akkermansiaceae bacterium]|nr:hypothetical protein [Akkermansiaceae bacterium]